MDADSSDTSVSWTDVVKKLGVTLDDEWVNTAKTLRNNMNTDSTVRLRAAYDDPAITPMSESTSAALRALLRHGLVAEYCEHVEESATPLAQFILSTALSGPSPVRFGLPTENGDDTNIIKYQSIFVLQVIAQETNVAIFIFSAKRKPIAFIPPSATKAIGFLKAVDFTAQAGQYLPLVASSHIGPSCRPRVPLPSRPITYPTAVAELRGESANTGKRRAGENNIDGGSAVEALKSACIEIMQARAKSSATEVFKAATQASSSRAMDRSAQELRHLLMNLEQLPRGTVPIATRIAREEHNTPSTFNNGDLRRSLPSSAKGMDVWKESVVKRFDGAWTWGMQEAAADDADKRAAKHSAKHHSKICDDQSDTEACDSKESNRVVGKGLGRERKPLDNVDLKEEDIRTCSVPLHHVLRQDIAHHSDAIQQSLRKTQETMTEMVSLLSFLVSKTILQIASGTFYNNSHGQVSLRQFKLSTVLPPGFELPSDMPRALDIIAIPDGLQSQIETSLKNTKGKKNDIDLLLSHEHIQILYTMLMGVQGRNKKDTHPLWTTGVKQILDHSDINDHPLAAGRLDGLRNTATNMIRQYSTALKNMWTKALYCKSRDNAIRTLLKMHLAPERNAANKERKKQFAKKKAADADRKASTRTVNRQLKQRLSLLYDDLARAIQRHPDQEVRIRSIRNAIDTTSKAIEKRLGTGIESKSHVSFDNDDIGSDTDFESDCDLDDDGQDSINNGTATQSLDDTLKNTTLPEPDGAIKAKEPSRKRLKTLEAIVRTIIESPSITERVNGNWLRKSVYVGTNLTETETKAMVMIINGLRPFVPRRSSDCNGSEDEAPKKASSNSRSRQKAKAKAPKQPSGSDGLKEGEEEAEKGDMPEHISLLAPMVLISNAVMQACQEPHHQREICPLVSAGSLYGLPMSAVELYETLCSRAQGCFDIQDRDGYAVTNYKDILASGDLQDTVFSSFFDSERIQQACRSHGLVFRNRITYVNRWTVRLSGTQIKHGPSRAGFPVEETYAKRKKKKKHRIRWDWKKELAESRLTKDEIRAKSESVKQLIAELEESLPQLNRRKGREEREKSRVAHEVRLKKKEYSELQHARGELEKARQAHASVQDRHSQAKKDLYCWNKLLKTTPSSTTAPIAIPELTTPTRERPAAIDAANFMDITQMITKDRDGGVAISGTDYGISTMSETGRVRLSGIIEHLNRFAPLTDLALDEGAVPVNGTNGQDAKKPTRKERVLQTKALRFPDSNKIKAEHINDACHAHKNTQKRERRLKADPAVQEAMARLSKASAAYRRNPSFSTLDRLQQVTLEDAHIIRDFEHSSARESELHHQEIRTTTVYRRVCAAERRYTKVQDDIPDRPAPQHDNGQDTVCVARNPRMEWAQELQTLVQEKLGDDNCIDVNAVANFIVEMVANIKSRDEILTELTRILPDRASDFAEWLFAYMERCCPTEQHHHELEQSHVQQEQAHQQGMGAAVDIFAGQDIQSMDIDSTYSAQDPPMDPGAARLIIEIAKGAD